MTEVLHGLMTEPGSSLMMVSKVLEPRVKNVNMATDFFIFNR